MVGWVMGFPYSSVSKESACNAGEEESLSRVRLFVTPWTVVYQAPLSMGFFLEKEMATHSNIQPGISHGQKSLVDYSPWGHKESDTTE